MARSKGWYAAAGIDLQILPYASNAPETLLASHQAECGISFQDSLTFVVAKGADIVSVAAILQRTAPLDPTRGSRLAFADLEMDTDTREVWRAGHAVELTATEFNLLRYFLLNPRRVLSKAQILDFVWDYDFDGNSNVLETYVSYLRKKLHALGPPLIHTVRLVGYVLREGPPGGRA